MSDDAAEPEPPKVADETFRRLVESVRDYAIFMLDAGWPHRFLEQRRAADQAIQRRRDRSGATSRSSTRKRRSPQAGPQEELRRSHGRKAASKTKAGACARTAAASGPTSSSRRCSTPRHAARLLEGHARPDGAKAPRGAAAGQRGAAAPDRRRRERPCDVPARPGGSIVSWNAAAERLLGYKPGEIVGSSVAMLYAPDDRDAGSSGGGNERCGACGSLRVRGLAHAGRRVAVLGRDVSHRHSRRRWRG